MALEALFLVLRDTHLSINILWDFFYVNAPTHRWRTSERPFHFIFLLVPPELTDSLLFPRSII
jgi:hypothetical protein